MGPRTKQSEPTEQPVDLPDGEQRDRDGADHDDGKHPAKHVPPRPLRPGESSGEFHND